jgi:energy-coupling factor transporter ATP-binding protein EcfA2
LAPGAQEEEVQARPVFPFTAIVGQEQMKLALMLNIIDPKIGGVMVMGDRGTGKSTTVRALTDLLPEIRVRVAWNVPAAASMLRLPMRNTCCVDRFIEGLFPPRCARWWRAIPSTATRMIRRCRATRSAGASSAATSCR